MQSLVTVLTGRCSSTYAEVNQTLDSSLLSCVNIPFFQALTYQTNRQTFFPSPMFSPAFNIVTKRAKPLVGVPLKIPVPISLLPGEGIAHPGGRGSFCSARIEHSRGDSRMQYLRHCKPHRTTGDRPPVDYKNRRRSLDFLTSAPLSNNTTNPYHHNFVYRTHTHNNHENHLHRFAHCSIGHRCPVLQTSSIHWCHPEATPLEKTPPRSPKNSPH